MGFLFERLAGVKADVLQPVEKDVGAEAEKQVKFKKAYGDWSTTTNEVAQVVGWMSDRYYWADVLSELRQVLIRVEQTTKDKLRTDAGVWIEQLTTAGPRPEGEATPGLEPSARGQTGAGSAAQDAFNKRYGLESRRMAPPAAAEPAPSGAPADGAAPASGRRKPKGDPNEIATLTITFRAVSLKNVSGQADADKGIAYTVLQELQRSTNVFDKDETRTEGDVSNDEQTGTFTFSVVARLKQPLKL
jgi:hypothetical protein